MRDGRARQAAGVGRYARGRRARDRLRRALFEAAAWLRRDRRGSAATIRAAPPTEDPTARAQPRPRTPSPPPRDSPFEDTDKQAPAGARRWTDRDRPLSEIRTRRGS